jgi:hypothetical protein
MSIGLHHPLDGVTNPEYKLLHFIQLNFFCKEKALAFNRDRCCHLALLFMADPLPLLSQELVSTDLVTNSFLNETPSLIFSFFPFNSLHSWSAK